MSAMREQHDKQGHHAVEMDALDRGTVFAAACRALPVLAAPVTVLLVAATLTPPQQGFYYTFLSVLAMHTLLEFGLGTALQQLVSHEWAHLRFGPRGGAAGDPDAHARLSALVRFAAGWCTVVAAVTTVLLAAGGILFFRATSQPTDPGWGWLWILLSALTGLTMCLSPGWAILEGCDQIAEVYRFRLFQGIAFRLALWAALLTGGGLWALVAERAVTTLSSLIFFATRYRALFRSTLFARSRLPRLWRREILPLQWRYAVVSAAGHLPKFFIPTVFAWHGPALAGRLGMTWTLAGSLLSVSHAIVAARVPRFAILVARRQFRRLDRLFARVFIVCCAAFTTGAGVLLIAIGSLYAAGHFLAERFLPVSVAAVLFLGFLLQQVRYALWAYLRAHKREPFVGIAVLEAALTLPVLLVLVRTYGAAGVAAGHLLVAAAVLFPAAAVFHRSRTAWHGDRSVCCDRPRGNHGSV